MDKHVAVVAGDRDVIDVVIGPGTTVHDVLTQSGLPSEYFLAKRGEAPLGNTEVLYPLVRDGEKLVASLQPVVGELTEAATWVS